MNGAVQIEVDNQSTGNASYAGLYLNGQGNNFFLKNWGDQVAGKSNVTEFISTASGSSFVFSTASTEAMRIDSSQRVGIGTTGPSYKLHVKETTTNIGAIQVDDGTSWLRMIPNLGGGGFNSLSTAGDLGLIFSTNNNSSTASGGLTIAPWSGATGAQGMRIKEDGNIGIGTASPASRLHISSGVAAANDVTLLTLENGNSTGDISTPDTFIDFTFTDANANTTPQARIGGHAGDGTDANSTTLEGKGYLTFHTSDTTGTSAAAPPERMRIRHDGTVWLGPNGEGYFRATVQNSFSSGWSANSDDHSTWINFEGYQGGTTKFRDLSIGNGKQAAIAKFDGSTGRLGIGTTTPSKLLHLSESADGSKLRFTRGGVSEWDFSIGNSSVMTGVGSGALEILSLNSGTARELAIGYSGASPLLHVKTTGIQTGQSAYLNQSGTNTTAFDNIHTHVIRSQGNNGNGGGLLVQNDRGNHSWGCLLYTSPSPRDRG